MTVLRGGQLLDHQIWSIMVIFYKIWTKKVEIMKMNNIKIYVNYSYYKNGNIRKLEYLMVIFFHFFWYFAIKIHKKSTILLIFLKMNWKIIWFRMIYKNKLFWINVAKNVVFIIWKNKHFPIVKWIFGSPIVISWWR